jgi:dynein heavy chain 1
MHTITGNELLGKLRKMRMLADDDEVVSTTAAKSQTAQPAWMRTLHERCREWLDQLPSVRQFRVRNYMYLSHSRYQQFATLAKQSLDSQDPLYRLFSREGSVGQKLLDQVRKDLTDVVKVCRGELKQTNHLRTLMSSLTKGI